MKGLSMLRGRRRAAIGWTLRQPSETYLGTPIEPKGKGLPRETLSLCPECTAIIPARIFEKDGQVLMEKTCPQHGEIVDLVWSDARLYTQMEEWDFGDNRGLLNPAIPDAETCPTDCGLCNIHTSHTGLANVDLTNRCNLTCPICFANANAAGYLYEPSFEEVVGMLRRLREERPVACRIVQFSGGEPTVYPRFLDVLRAARELGFSHIQMASNGLRLADRDFALACAEAGLHTIYLQFDGLDDEVYRRTRGERLMERKARAMENIRAAGMKIVFVPTIVKGVNDHQVGEILRFALENIDVMSGISFQPVTFTGRISTRERWEKRFTLPDLARCIEEQTGIAETYRDWFPLNCTTPFSKVLGVVRGEETVTLSCHTHCSIGTYLFVDQHKRATPVTRFIDIGEMFKELDLLSRRNLTGGLTKALGAAAAFQRLKRHFHEDRAPERLTFRGFLQTLEGFVDKTRGRGASDGVYTYKTLLVAGMHFMDSYNYDVDRVKRCVIHYSAPDGRIYPFCAYNSGPCFRTRVEQEYSVPMEEVLRRAEAEGNPPELQSLVRRMRREWDARQGAPIA